MAYYLQPLLTGKVFASVGILIAAQLFLFLADRFWGLESIPVQKGPVISSEQTVQMSLSDLQNFLASVSRETQPLTGLPAPSTGQGLPGTLSGETPEIPLIFALTVYGEFTEKPLCPTVFLLFPILTFSGVQGALPLLILETLSTIFVRAVVPPETTGSRPPKDPASTKPNLLQFTPEELLKLLNRFSKHFRT